MPNSSTIPSTKRTPSHPIKKSILRFSWTQNRIKFPSLMFRARRCFQLKLMGIWKREVKMKRVYLINSYTIDRWWKMHHKTWWSEICSNIVSTCHKRTWMETKYRKLCLKTKSLLTASLKNKHHMASPHGDSQRMTLWRKIITLSLKHHRSRRSNIEILVIDKILILVHWWLINHTETSKLMV